VISGNDSRNRKRSFFSFLIVLSGILISCITAFFGYDILPDYQDKLVHLRRIAALADTLKAGYFPARIYFAMNRGTGYAMPVFYPDINLYVPAFLHIAGLPLGVVYTVYVVITNFVTAVITYFCIKGFLKCIPSSAGAVDAHAGETGGCIPAAVASFLYTLSVYRLTNVYIRDAAGEYTAMALLPLVIYGFALIYTGNVSEKRNLPATIRCALPLGAGMAALACSHILTTMVATAFLLVTAIVLFKRTFTPAVMTRLAAALLIFFGLSAFAVVPMIDYMLSDTYLVSASSYIMRGFCPGWRELLELIPSGSGSGIAYELRMPTAIGASLTAVLSAWAVREALLLAGLFGKKRPSAFFTDIHIAELYLFTLSGIALFISSKYFPWTYIESGHNFLTALFCSIQFSWRYIGIATVFTVFLGAMLIRDVLAEKRKNGICLSVLLVLLSLIPALILEIRACSENRHAPISTGAEIGIVSDELYFPVSWNREAVYDRVPLASGEAVITGSDIEEYRWHVSVSAEDGDGTVTFPVVYYKGYGAVADDGRKLETFQGDDGRVSVRIPSGFSGSFVMKFSESLLWRASEALSLISAAIICIVMCINGKPGLSGRRKTAEVTSSD